MRNISFFLTTDQIRNGTKTVTRRLGWRTLTPGQLLQACVKCQGLKPGEKLERLRVIRVVSVRREPLHYITRQPGDMAAEGFPSMTAGAFISCLCGT